MSLAQINPFDYFSDTKGDPLDAGYIYVGVANQDPVTNPIAIYYDAAMTIPAPQPLRTVAGYISNPIAPQTFFTNQNYSVSVRDKNQVVLFYVANFSSIVSNTPFALQLAASNAWIAAFQADTQAWGDNFIATNDAWAANYRATNEAWAAAFQANLIQRYLSFNNRGNWATGTGYAIQDLVIQGSIAYICLIAHTSGVFATDLANGDWAIYQGATKSELGASNGSSLIGFIQAGTGAVQRTMQGKGRDFVTPFDFGAVGDGVADDTAALVAMHASGRRNFDYLDGTYLVNFAELSSLISYTNVNNIQIVGRGAVIKDNRAYASGSFTNIFQFNGCNNVSIVGVNYIGIPLPNPATSSPAIGVGYLGATFVELNNACQNVTVEAYLQDCRYGVRSGDYLDYTKGRNKNTKTRIVSLRCGYPIAHYLADEIDHVGYADYSHRAAYMAGVRGGSCNVSFANNYIASVMALVSDATLNGIQGAGGVSRGSSNLKVRSVDRGSTTYKPNLYCCGISLSRVDPNTVYENIEFEFGVASSDSQSSTIGGFIINSAVSSALPGSYSHNWIPSIYLWNISAKGVIDRSSQTVASSGVGDIYISPQDDKVSYYGTVDNLTLRDVNIIPSTGVARACYLQVFGLNGTCNIDRCSFGASPLEFSSNPNYAINFTNCSPITKTSGSSGDTGKLSFINTTITQTGQPTTNAVFYNSPYAGQPSPSGQLTITNKTVDVTLSGTTTVSTAFFPVGAIVFGMTGRIVTSITGSTGFQLGVVGDLTRYINSNSTASGTTFTNAAASTTTAIYPITYFAGTDLQITSKTSAFTGGVLRLNIAYGIIGVPA